MSRATRIEFPGAIYHAMGRGVGGMKVFTEDGDFRKFLDLAGERVDGGDLIVHAFCLMSNHYHLLLETPRGGLSRWMHGILGTYAEWFNFTRKRRGHLWQGRYKAILVERGPYLLECSRYIHLNPNRAGLTRPAERWEWSSYRNYVSALGKPVAPWVTVDTVLGELGLPESRRKPEGTHTGNMSNPGRARSLSVPSSERLRVLPLAANTSWRG